MNDPETEKKKQNLVFSGMFKLRPEYWEEFVFDFKDWPLGVQNLICCETSCRFKAVRVVRIMIMIL